MKEIIIGTANQAKVDQIRGALVTHGITVSGMAKKIDVEEDGKTIQENARKKATTYAKVLGKTVLSMDNALFLNGLAEEDQPGMHVRRIKGRTDRPTDEELLNHYVSLIDSLGGKVRGGWHYGFCVATPQGKFFETTIIDMTRIFTSVPSKKSIPGYPLESIQVHPENGKYFAEMKEDEINQFWQKNIGEKLFDFIKTLKI